MDTVLEVTGMHCGSCVALIEETLSEDPAVETARVDLEAARAYVTFDPERISVDELCEAIAQAGYAAAPAAGPAAPAADGPAPAAPPAPPPAASRAT